MWGVSARQASRRWRFPTGFDPTGRPQGIILSGPHLSDLRIITVGTVLELALNAR